MMKNRPSSERVFSIFKALNQIPRPSHHEERVADYLCQFAERLHLDYERDAANCVVIRKPASKGYKRAEPVVLLNHMDMVCVGMRNPLTTPIETYTECGWMKARGTSLGADNGIGLSMALAVLEDPDIIHGPLEVITTTNEEDGMSGASQLSPDFLRGRKVINLDSEDFDTITTGAAGACLQFHEIPVRRQKAPDGHEWLRISFKGGLGGHSGVDINKGRVSATVASAMVLTAISNVCELHLSYIKIGEANASIASTAEMIVCVPSGDVAFVKAQEEEMNYWLRKKFRNTDPDMRCHITVCGRQADVVNPEAFEVLLTCLNATPQGVIKMSAEMERTVETSNNVGMVETRQDYIFVSTHSRSFIDEDLERLAEDIASVFQANGAVSRRVMMAPAWQENQHSPFIQLTSDTFNDVLGWRPRMVAMHFVLEAGYFVQKYPGIQIASIGPRIMEPHSTSERVQLSTVNDIWKVLLELLYRLATA